MTVVLVEQNTELAQLCQALEQLREEKAKEIGRADKLAEELIVSTPWSELVLK